jgi:hypothetical protein
MADDDDNLLKAQGVAPFNVGADVGKNSRVSGGAYYDPRDQVLSAEGGIEHKFGKRTTLGVEGNYQKFIGPGGEHEKPNWGVGVRGRIKFAGGGKVTKHGSPTCCGPGKYKHG